MVWGVELVMGFVFDLVLLLLLRLLQAKISLGGKAAPVTGDSADQC